LQRLLQGCPQELLLPFCSPDVPFPIASVAHIAHGIIAVQLLCALLQVNVQVLRPVCVVHRLLDVDNNPAENVDHLLEPGKIATDVVVYRLGREQLGDGSKCQFRTAEPIGRIDPVVSMQIRKVAVEAFLLTECRSMARVDFFLREDKTFILNEINTLPGFTNISMYPKLWDASGLAYPELLDRLIELALE